MWNHHPRTVLLALCLGFLLAPLAAQEGDPAEEEVVLEERSGWQSSLVFDAGCGVWCVKSFNLYPELACPEIVACDDRGRGTILISYSGKWTPKATVLDGKWLAPMDQGRFAMGEGVLLLGGAGGRLYEVRPRAAGHADVLLRAEFPGEEIHTILTLPSGDERTQDRALVFLMSGRVFEYRASAEDELVRSRRGDQDFVIEELPQIEGRVRDAFVAERSITESSAVIWTVSRAGRLVRRRVEIPRGGPSIFHDEVVLEEPQGLGRIARGVGPFAKYVYVTRDDGLYLRVHRDEQGRWRREVIHRGEQGPRGLVAGRFDEDPEVESLAIFGYSGKVELLRRRGDEPFRAETLFVDRDKGHWLAKAELDGRNETDEIIASGYSGRVVLLARLRPGKGSIHAAAPEGSEGRGTRANGAAGAVNDAPETAAARPIRVAVEKIPAARDIDPFRYGGGFFTKSATFATLIRRDAEGRLAPELARSWRFEDEGRTWIFELDTSRVLQDGSRLDAAAVADHFRRIIGAREHAWLGLARLLEKVETPAADRVVFRLREAWALEEDLLAVNPCGLRAPGALDAEGRFLRPLGSGPLRPRVESATAERLAYVDAEDRPVFELVAVAGGVEGFRRALAEGRVDLVIDGWERRVDPARSETDAVGSVSDAKTPLCYLVPNAARPGLREAAERAAVVAALGDRQALLELAESGAGTALWSWTGPAGDARSAPPRSPGRELVLLVNANEDWQLRVARALQSVAADSGLGIRLHALDQEAWAAAKAAGDFDLLLERSWGGAYDPHLSLVCRFGPGSGALGPPARFLDLVARLAAEPDSGRRRRLLAEVDRMVVAEAALIPLYRPHRLFMSNRKYRAPADPYRIVD